MSNFIPYVCMQTNSKCYKNTNVATVVGVLWHSTGANNTSLKRYVQPTDGSVNYSKDIAKLGKNNNGNDWNHLQTSAGVNAFIGKFADGSIGTVQTMPWNYAPWGCGSGSKGSLNKVDGKMWIQFEICEDALTDKIYAKKVYDEAIALTAYLCEKYKLDPNGTVTVKGVKVPVITCHNDANKLGFGTSHADINHWFPKLIGKDMAAVRADVKAKMQGAAASYSKEWVNGLWYEEDGSQTYKYEGMWKQNAVGWWFEDTSGWYPKSDWVKIDGDWYYFEEDGYMASNKWVDDSWVDKDGKYDSSKKKTTTTTKTTEYQVRITAGALNVRKSASASSNIVGTVFKNNVVTIVDEKDGFGKLKSGKGWIKLSYTVKI